MIKINRWRSFLRPLLATALPFGLLAAGAMSAHAGSVTVTGANGANGAYPGDPGAGGGAATATATTAMFPSDASNTATATGGNGGTGGNSVEICHVFQGCRVTPAGAGGPGGAATAGATTSISSATAATATATSVGGTGGAGGSNKTRYYASGTGGGGGAGSSSATASNAKGSASATATSTGGRGGVGGYPAGPGGAGGGASASSSATGGGVGAVLSQATAHAGAGGEDGPSLNVPDPYGYGGAAQAYATGVALTGNVQANASAYGGWALVPGTAAFAQSEAKNSKGEALTTATAPRDAGGILPSAVTSVGVGSGSIILSPSASQVVSDAILTLTGPTNHETIGEGAMSAAFSGGLLQQTYAATAVFDFTTSESEALDLNVLSDKAVGIGFDSLELQVINLVDTTTLLRETFSSLTGSNGAGTFFAPGHSISLPGEIGAGSESIAIDYSLSYWNTTSITPNASFGFTYALVDPPVPSIAAIPEPSTWAMMLVGFAGLAFAGYRVRVRSLIAKET